MNRNDVKNVVKLIGGHCKVLWKGFKRMMYGALTAGLFAMAIGGFAMITTESGWVAVSEFIASVCTAIVALTNMYVQGGGVKKGAKK